MTTVFPLRRLTSSGLTLLVALGALHVVVAGDTSPSVSTAARVHRLAQNVERAESVRAVKRVQETYAQYSQFGLWTDMAALFADNAQLSYGKDNEHGRQAIQNYFLTTFGEGTHGLKPGGLHTQMVLRPLINVSADGQSAKGRWWEFSMTGQHGVKAEWAAGIFENEYVRERGVWKISRMRYNPMFAGPYATGWRNVDEDQKIVPYHFTPNETGIPVPDLPASAMPAVDPKMQPATALAALEQRISVMNEEDKVRNLQNAYGYYMDRKMWDDVTDLFTADGALSVANVGVYDGPKSIRRALERSGPAGLKHGQLNELMQLDMAVAIEPGGMEARARGLEFGMLGEADSGSPNGTAFYTLAIFENRYVKQNDIWRIREMRVFPLMKTDYAQGWAKSQVVDPPPAKEHAPDRPVPASDVMTPGAIPVFFVPNPATGKPVSLPSGAKTVGRERLLPAPATRTRAEPSGGLDARMTEAERRLAVSKAWDGAENMSTAYGDYLDDLDFGGLGKLFALKGHKEVPFSGFYVGRQRIIDRDATAPPPGSRPRAMLPLHWRTQPVILVAEDGRSASIRSRLFQPGSSHTRAMGFGGGMYHDQVVLEDGVWKFWSVVIDEHYFSSPTYEGGWSSAKDPVTPRRPPTPNATYPPDIPLTKLGERERGFRGGTGEEIAWPGILPMWFHYKNPVSGRVPENYWPDCVPCAQYPETSMKNHGYVLPPS
jgi:hypothetical protein